jgi:hypothetical protein
MEDFTGSFMLPSGFFGVLETRRRPLAKYKASLRLMTRNKLLAVSTARNNPKGFFTEADLHRWNQVRALAPKGSVGVLVQQLPSFRPSKIDGIKKVVIEPGPGFSKGIIVGTTLRVVFSTKISKEESYGKWVSLSDIHQPEKNRDVVQRVISRLTAGIAQICSCVTKSHKSLKHAILKLIQARLNLTLGNFVRVRQILDTERLRVRPTRSSEPLPRPKMRQQKPWIKSKAVEALCSYELSSYETWKGFVTFCKDAVHKLLPNWKPQ